MSKINHSNQREFTANNVKILVISSCSKRKAEYSDLSFNDLDSTKKRKRILKSKKRKKYKAVDLYQGYQNREINSAIDELRQDLEVDQLILSAGWGLLEENDLIVSYDASFQSKSDEEIDSLAQRLEIQSDFKKFIKNKEYSLIYIALGPPYMRALGDLDFLQKNADEVVIFCSVEEMDTNLSSRISYFSLEEFWKLEKQNTSVIKSPFYLGKRYQARGSIFRNFVYYLCNYRSPSLSFISWWHLLYDCGCQKEKLS
ncbi:MAG: hypothetical protein GPJ54_20095 [Candidatus Heimdallarchaeota archaeon]|nr:hypothetical protein [Candidatus Heimdallarchaeota archaeon]